MQTKNVPALIKSSADDTSLDEGQFTALVSVFNTVDSVGDVVIPGAFRKSLDGWAAKGAPLPVVWSHDWNDPFSHIGYVTDAKETDAGLQVSGQLDLENPKAKQVYRLLKGGRVKNWSFSYDIDNAARSERNGKSVQELHELTLHEIGPCLVGAHRSTDTVEVKQAAVTVNVNSPTDDAPGLSTQSTDAAAASLDQLQQKLQGLGESLRGKSEDPVIARLVKALDALDSELVDVESKAAPPGFTPKPIVARIRKLVAAAQALLDAVEPDSKPDDSKAMPAQPSQPEPPAVVAPGPDPVRHGAASSRLRTDLDLLWAEADSYTI